MMLLDTDVLIWFMRGNKNAAIELSKLPTIWQISAVTYAELVQGCRNKNELILLKKGLNNYQTLILPITPNITHTAIQLVETFHLSHGMQLADALIAATAIKNQLTLFSGNAKHFKNITQLSLQVFKP